LHLQRSSPELPRFSGNTTKRLTVLPNETTEPGTTSEMLDALVAVATVLSCCEERTALIRRRIAEIQRGLAAGRPLRAVVSPDARPLAIELLTQFLSELQTAGVRLRRAEAAALYRQGATISEIAYLFGVSRQRVSALLRAGRAYDASAP
jgi:DNA-binding CsgD family transcriptional regulator